MELFFRIKTSYTDENAKGALVQVKNECLVMASTYTDAEKIAYSLLEGKDHFGSTDYEIIKTKIAEMLYNSAFVYDTTLNNGLVTYYFEEDEQSEVGVYAVKVRLTEDLENGKSKDTNEVIYTPAVSAVDAIEFVKAYLKDVETRSFIVRDAKFDKSSSVMVTPNQHTSNLSKFAKYE